MNAPSESMGPIGGARVSIRKGSLFVAMVATALIVGSVPLGAAANEGSGAGEIGTCVDVAKLAAEHSKIKKHKTVQFACFGNQVVVNADPGTPSEERAQVEVKFSDEAAAGDSATSRSAEPGTSQSAEPLAVPYTAASTTAGCGGATRTIVSELQERIAGCTPYGKYNTTTGAVIWQRTIDWQWTMYTGRPSAQNIFKIVPATGSPTMSGAFTSRKQNGVFTPTNLVRTTFSNASFATTTSWTGGMTAEGSHSVLLGSIRVVDSAMGYNGYLDGGIPSHRFTCSTSQNRCYFPGGQEAPL